MSKSEYTPVIGMEVHVELSTKRKMFCWCDATHFQVKPNSHVCPVCLGLPGALPVPNRVAIEDTVKFGLALGCSINLESKFDRKHYFYPDLPKGYQISQYDQPLCEKGAIILGNGKKVRVTRVHLEEDTGKLQHATVKGEEVSLVDYNRSGVPLMEIVSEPDLSSAEEAKEYLKLIHSTVRYLGISDADMEKGSMRLEANISVGKGGSLPDYKVEVKNVNSFRYIAAAIDYEIERHIKLLEKGETPAQETRGWSQDDRTTFSQRGKEEAKDYRYFPEPDIPPIHLEKSDVEKWTRALPDTPMKVRDSLVSDGVRKNYAEVVITDQQRALTSLTLVTEAKKEGVDPDKLLGMVVNNNLNEFDPIELIKEYKAENEKEMAGGDDVARWVQEAVDENAIAVADYKAGKENAIQFLLGQVMKKAKGSADAGEVTKLLLEKLD